MQSFDAPMHGKHISLRDFSMKFDHAARTEEAAGEEHPHKRNSSWHVLSVCIASAMTVVHALQGGARDWGPEADLMHFFLAAFLPLRIYGRLCFPEKSESVWPSLALHVAVMLCAYPYDTERVSVVVFVGVLVYDGASASRRLRGRSLAWNAGTLLVLLNAVLCLLVYANDSGLVVSYYHASFLSLGVLLVVS